jgi:hypothetical protein
MAYVDKNGDDVPFPRRKSQKMGHFGTWAMVRTILGRQMMRFGARSGAGGWIGGNGRAFWKAGSGHHFAGRFLKPLSRYYSGIVDSGIVLKGFRLCV